MISLIIVRAILGSNGEGKLQSASLLGRAVTRCFVFIPLARFPFLLSLVFEIGGADDGKGVVLSLLRAREGSCGRGR